MTIATGESDPLALDRKELTERMMGNIQIAQRMLRQFLDAGPKEVDVLESTIRMGSPEETASLAHRHKGTAKTLAAPRVAEISMTIEQKAREGDLSDLLVELDSLRAAHAELASASDQWFSESESGAEART